jgi:hypothetical protein
MMDSPESQPVTITLYVVLSFFRITHTVILDDPFDDPRGLQVPDCSPEPSPAALMVSEQVIMNT